MGPPDPDQSKWQCPIECPNSQRLKVLAIVSRVTLPILTASVIGFTLWAITSKEDRAPSQTETALAIGALFVSYQPTLVSMLAKEFAAKHL